MWTARAEGFKRSNHSFPLRTDFEHAMLGTSPRTIRKKYEEDEVARIAMWMFGLRRLGGTWKGQRAPFALVGLVAFSPSRSRLSGMHMAVAWT